MSLSKIFSSEIEDKILNFINYDTTPSLINEIIEGLQQYHEKLFFRRLKMDEICCESEITIEHIIKMFKISIQKNIIDFKIQLYGKDWVGNGSHYQDEIDNICIEYNSIVDKIILQYYFE